VGIFKALLRVFSYIFGGLLAFFLTAVSSLALAHHSDLDMGFLPWTGTQLSVWLLGSGLFGLVFVLLAMAGKLRVLFFLWSAAVFVMLLRGFFLTHYLFLSGLVMFKTAVYLTLGAVAGAIGAFPWPEKPRPMRKPEYY